jgi:hypothetical protein
VEWTWTGKSEPARMWCGVCGVWCGVWWCGVLVHHPVQVGSDSTEQSRRGVEWSGRREWRGEWEESGGESRVRGERRGVERSGEQCRVVSCCSLVLHCIALHCMHRTFILFHFISSQKGHAMPFQVDSIRFKSNQIKSNRPVFIETYHIILFYSISSHFEPCDSASSCMHACIHVVFG